jgi:hypothetical protein
VGTVNGTSIAVSPATTTTYTLTATNGAGSVTAQVQVMVTPLPSITAFTASPTAINLGQSTQLSWTVNGATSLSIDHGVGTVNGTSTMVSPAATTTYTLTATNGAGSVTAQVPVTVTPPPVITAFTASPTALNQGQSTQLSWTVNGATSLSIDHGVGAVNGTSTVVSPAATTTYTLTATNGAGNVTAQAPVTVNSLPPSIAYGSGNFSFTVGTAISTLDPLNTGGPVVSWSINPALPAGLGFSALDGSISGTPSTLSPASGYTVTATNTGGSCMVVPMIAVNPPLPAVNVPPAACTVDRMPQRISA